MFMAIYWFGFWAILITLMWYLISEEFNEIFDGIYDVTSSAIFVADIIICGTLAFLWPIICGVLFVIWGLKQFSYDITKLLVYILITFGIAFQFQSDLDFCNKDFNKYFITAKTQYKQLTHGLFEIVYRESVRYHLRPLMVCSVINAESDWDQYATSCSNARGYMQVMDFHIRDHYKYLYRTDINISLGCRYLWQCQNHSRHNLSETFRKYNQGIYGNRGRYRNWGYVNKIKRHFAIMIRDYNEEGYAI